MSLSSYEKRIFDLFQGVFCTYPDLPEYETKELYRQHPALPHVWKNFEGIDDLYRIFECREIYSVDSENNVSRHASVQACLFTGQVRCQAALIIEPRAPIYSVEEEDALLDALRPTI